MKIQYDIEYIIFIFRKAFLLFCMHTKIKVHMQNVRTEATASA